MIKIGLFKPDKWSFYHLGGWFMLTHLLRAITGSLVNAVVIAIVVGVVWELIEGIMYYKPFVDDWTYPVWFPVFGGEKMFDPRGGSIDDILFDLVGCGLAILF